MKRVCLLSAALFALSFGWGCDSDNGGEGTGGSGGVQGDAFPAGTAKDCSEADVDLLAMIAENEVTYLAFGAVWCVPCQQEVPIINTEVVDAFAGQPVGAVQILLQNKDSQAATAQDCNGWVSDLEPKFDILFDADESLAAQHFNGNVSTLPRHVIVLKDGTVVFEKDGAVPENLQQLVGDWVP